MTTDTAARTRTTKAAKSAPQAIAKATKATRATATPTRKPAAKADTAKAMPHTIRSRLASGKRTIVGDVTGPRVYSYIRFSSEKQASGTSIERQSEYAAEWAAAKGLTLDTTLTMYDLGLSAWKGEHLEKGALGGFIKAIEKGRIAPGSVLIVESLDRLSRDKVNKAQELFLRIINAGVCIVTASDNKEYSAESIGGSNGGIELIISLTIMIRANEESSTKSDRVQRALRTRCQQWIAGKWRGNIRAGRDPSWVTWTGSGFELKEASVQALRAMIQLYGQGYGPRRITEMLDDQGITLPWGLSQQTRFYEIMRNRTLLGERALEVMGETFVLPGYYPAVLTVEQFDHLQLMLSGRSRRGGGVKGEIPPLFTGMRMCMCGHCKWAMAGQNMADKRFDDGSYPDFARRINCSGSSKPDGCRTSLSTSVVPIEHAIMAYCSDQGNLDAMRASGAGKSTISARIAKARTERTKLEAQAGNLTAALAGGKSSRFVMAELEKLEKRLDALNGEIMAMQREYTALSQSDAAANADAWLALIGSATALDYDARMQVRGLVADTFESVIIFIDGFGHGAPGYVDIELKSRQGVLRWLRVDRSTGEWVQGHDIDMLALPVEA
ncbi:DNA invertase Pin-like site-specific DNA recombinase [Paraburkholderia sp. HC6.4b]|uniref:recombinase family protein n=1 Tax=unclassified Paraburkholderia TaxID=2615204 RepID=UPI00160B807F|nr:MULTISPECIES: recombinase family protein [unclassified Paraburkholderia]MBB5408563.1 DNA invertase Pin-like site-specific DNA recombinase [Paraburkholderia sp. HC6.4b]MBB5450395.1 DNA invertase Pin-like site-specific DNA recombinase [Paraburkholderia sp. Kb1A]